MNTEDYYLKWIATAAAKKYRNSPKYRYSEMIAFANAFSIHQNKKSIEVLIHAKKNLIKSGFANNSMIIREINNLINNNYND